jgi:hypothetical protein
LPRWPSGSPARLSRTANLRIDELFSQVTPPRSMGRRGGNVHTRWDRDCVDSPLFPTCESYGDW